MHQKAVGERTFLTTTSASGRRPRSANRAASGRETPKPTASEVLVVGNNCSHLLYAHDSISWWCFLVNTGAAISAIPVTASDRTLLDEYPFLHAVNRTNNHTYGTHSVMLCIDNQQFQWKFMMAAVDRPLLDSDFIAAHGFLVPDMQDLSLILVGKGIFS